MIPSRLKWTKVVCHLFVRHSELGALIWLKQVSYCFLCGFSNSRTVSLWGVQWWDLWWLCPVHCGYKRWYYATSTQAFNPVPLPLTRVVLTIQWLFLEMLVPCILVTFPKLIHAIMSLSNIQLVCKPFFQTNTHSVDLPIFILHWSTFHLNLNCTRLHLLESSCPCVIQNHHQYCLDWIMLQRAKIQNELLSEWKLVIWRLV